ncbi:serine hydrolase domain-containing protein [Mycolicibacterium sp.]|uniref:serine hydrolase domain-containing protein n=1 Tax=Mycolicibacterium sp. TaxID=2320850 RepID=UPI001D659682|nr:serine hydrolase domain-containing protein [Mycolicibacterium sp.]MCB1292602.1 beta-lactamase family protein [Mycobacterium sp.]MCB9409675.1 beta-lactamase family protein [Mycolicibacterium sp.]
MPSAGGISRRGMMLVLAAAMAGCAHRAPDGRGAATATPGPPAPELPLPVFLARNASPEFRAVADALVEAMRGSGIPGAALGILTDRREEHATFGVASASSLRPVTSNTLFQIGSLSKTYTATAVWRLIDERKLAVDGPVRRYLRGLRLRDRETIEAVTVGNLLDHTAGWYGDEIVDTGDGPYALARYVDTRLPELPQLFRCGEFFSYNNAAFQLLGRLVELAATADYNEAMQRLVLGPLGLANTVLHRAEVLKRPYCDGHTAIEVNGRQTVAVQTPLWVPRNADPAGGIWSTTRDVLRYARLHLGLLPPEKARIITAASRTAMQEPAVPVPGLELSMGRSWFVQDVDGLRVISHDGDTLGQHTVFVAVPERRFAFVLLLNGQPGAAAGLAALKAALARYPGLAPLSGRVGPLQALLAPEDPPDFRLGSAELRSYAGRYADPGRIETFRVSASGMQRSLELIELQGAWQPALAPPPPEPAAVRFLARDLAVTDGLRLPFVRDPDGRVGWVADSLRLRPRA